MATAEEKNEAADLKLESADPAVKKYQRQKLALRLTSLLLLLFGLALLSIYIGPVLQVELGNWVGENRWLRLIVVAAVVGGALELFNLPFDFYSSFVLEHRHNLSNQSLSAWIAKRLKSWIVGAAILLPMWLGLYAILWYSGPVWWIWAALGWLLVRLGLGRIAPLLILPLFYKLTPIDDASLRERLVNIAEGTGLAIEGVYRLHVSGETKKANAALTGLGQSRRVLLGDTLLENFTPEEIEVVFAHEVGHHVHKHLPKMMVMGVALVTAGFWLADYVLHSSAAALGYRGFDDPSALALLLLVLVVMGLVLKPVNNAIYRFFERQCDRYALERTGRHAAYRSAFIKLAKQNKSDPDPNPLVVWFFYDHPPIRQRLALADN